VGCSPCECACVCTHAGASPLCPQPRLHPASTSLRQANDSRQGTWIARLASFSCSPAHRLCRLAKAEASPLPWRCLTKTKRETCGSPLLPALPSKGAALASDHPREGPVSLSCSSISCFLCRPTYAAHSPTSPDRVPAYDECLINIRLPVLLCRLRVTERTNTWWRTTRKTKFEQVDGL
jgi:hypothetical protein